MISFNNFLQRVVAALAIALAVPTLGGAFVVASGVSAEAAVVSSVSVRGNQRVDPITIETYITIKPGEQFGAADIDESIKILYGTGLFSDVDIRTSGRILVVTVAENPVVNSVVFEGNRKVKSNILVQIVSLQPRGVLTDAKLQSDVNRIKQYYGRQGRPGVQVDARVNEIGSNRVNVVFYIVEGNRTGVATISFVGNKAFSKQRLRSVLQTQQTNFMSWLNRRDIFSEEKLAADKEALRRHYLKYGYADFQILATDVDLDADRGKYHIVFTIEEGPKYRFGQVNIDSSIPGVDPAALTGVVKTRSGRVFDATKVETTVEALTIELSRLGFVFAQVRPRGDRNYVDNIIDLTYVIDEGARAYIERIDIRGNTKTRDYVIRREFDIAEGDAFNRVLIDKAERRLRGLDYFETVRIFTQSGSAPDKVVVVVEVADKSTGSVSAAVGVSTSSGLIGEISLEERNFLGRGQIVRVSVGGGEDDRTYNVSFTDPYFLGNRILFGIDAYHATSNSSSIRPFDEARTGGGFRVGLPLTDESDILFNYRLNSSEYSNSGATGLFPNGTRVTSSLGYTYTYSTIDNRLDPRDGFHFKLSQDFAGVGGDASYMRTVADAYLYKPVLPDQDVIGMLHIGGGNVTGLGKSVSLYDNFYKGGETIRGFESFGFGPRDAGAGGTGFAVGGKNYVAGTAELQFPMPAFPPDFGLRGAVFADAGLMWGVDGAPSTVLSDTTIRSSVGGSILWASPFGLLRADFAHVLSKASYDRTQLFRFGAGAKF